MRKAMDDPSHYPTAYIALLDEFESRGTLHLGPMPRSAAVQLRGNWYRWRTALFKHRLDPAYEALFDRTLNVILTIDNSNPTATYLDFHPEPAAIAVAKLGQQL